MSDNPDKTPLDHVTDTLSQLKEMRHYSGNNVETLTAQWLLFDGEQSKLEQTAKIDDLMTRQGELQDALERVIADVEELGVKLQPPHETKVCATSPTVFDFRVRVRVRFRVRGASGA